MKNLYVYRNLKIERPGFLSGFSRVFDVGGIFNPFKSDISRSGLYRDAAVQKSDWMMVGRDISESMEKFQTDR